MSERKLKLQEELSKMTYGEVRSLHKIIKILHKKNYTPTESVKLLRMLINVFENSLVTMKNYVDKDLDSFKKLPE